ncbi:MAG: sulfite exporter TauE/SafE family protein [Arcobacteraceae bacterium]|nr:sulfite exporter TauE/SafE family protein [Arcobacteraceae bacterium]
MELSFEFLIALGLILFISGIFHGTIGFGFPMIATPLLALFTDIQTAIMFTIIPTILVNLTSIISEEKFMVVVKNFYPFAVIAMVGSALGTLLLIYAHSNYFKLFLALMILCYLLMDNFKINSRFVQQHPKKALGLFGLSAGFFGGLTNVMAPLLIVYSMESKFTKSQTIQFSNLCFLLGKIIQFILFSLYGTFTLQNIGLSLGTLSIVAVALYWGIKIKRQIDIKTYQRFIKVLLFVISLVLLYQVYSVSGEAM